MSVTNTEAREALGRILNFCEEIDYHLDPDEMTGYKMLPDYLLISDYLSQAVDVVRCKDCKYWQDNNGGYPHEECRWGREETPEADDYCSCGERRETQ